MRNEEKFLLLCSCVELQESCVTQLRDIASRGLDWEYLLEISLFHRVLPLLYHNIIKVIPDIPPDNILRKLKETVTRNGAKNLFLVSELIALLNKLAECEIPVLVFKGPVLAEDIFGNVGLRSFGDLDLLISHEDLNRTVSLLKNLGFRQDVDLSLEQYEKLVDKSHHAVLVKDGVVVELHWELTGRYFSHEIGMESFMPRADFVELAGKKIPTFGSEDLLLYLCIHGCRHYWFQLDAVCCVAELVKKRRALDWDLVLQLAREHGALKMVCIGLLLARELMGLTLPDSLEDVFSKYKKLEKYASGIAERIFLSTEFSEAQMSYREYVAYHHAIMDKTSDWLLYCLRPPLNPTHSDWLWIRLPAPLSFLYYVLRPVRLLKKYTKKMMG